MESHLLSALQDLVQLGSPEMTNDWAHWLEKVLRPVVVYLFLVFLLRNYGRRTLAQLNPFDFVVLLMLSNTVQNAIIGQDTSLVGGLVGAVALLESLLGDLFANRTSVDLMRHAAKLDLEQFEEVGA